MTDGNLFMVSSDKIAVSLNVHTDPFLVRTNINCLQINLTNNINMLIEESAFSTWPFDKFEDVNIIKGFKHDFKRNPYRNVFYNLIETYKKFPDKEWYCYTEGDNFFLNDTIKKDLELIKPKFQLVTSDFRTIFCDGYLFYNLFNKVLRNHFCMLGCCYFIRKEFMEKLCNEYFPKFLNYATLIPDCYYYPNFYQYDLAEVFVPTACAELNYSIFNLSSWKMDRFVGMSHIYKMRFRPEILKFEINEKTCIVHAIKNRKILTNE